jgi:two-component system LytT family response regulator
MFEFIQAIIVEDEFHQRETLMQKLQEYHPEVTVVAACDNAETALVEIVRSQPQLIFLDIQLPCKNGLWLADQLSQMACDTFSPPCIIFTTAYSDSEYLLNAIRLSAIDYLIKPIQIDSLAIAINRFKKRKESSPTHSLAEIIQKENMFRFKNFGGLLLVKAEDIAYVEGDGNYSTMYLANGEQEEIFERLGEIEQALSSDNAFIRTGKSVVINKNYVRRINSRQATLQIVTPSVSYDVQISANAIRMMKNCRMNEV